MSALKLIYDKLLAGEEFGTIDQHRLGGTYFWRVLSADKQYIRWCHYGSSANKRTMEDLKWIITVIFRMTPEEFLYKYTTYSEWKRINSYYEKEDEKCS